MKWLAISSWLPRSCVQDPDVPVWPGQELGIIDQTSVSQESFGGSAQAGS